MGWGWHLCLGGWHLGGWHLGGWHLAVETHNFCFLTAPFSLNSLKKLVKCHWISSFPISNGTFDVEISCFSFIGTIELPYFHIPMVPSLITDGDFLI